MAFWTNKGSPKLQYRFRISDTETDNSYWYWAKSVTKPSVSIANVEYKLINGVFKYPTVATWNDITITIVDDGDQTQKLYDYLKNAGYYTPDTQNISVDGISKELGSMDSIVIEQLDSSGKSIETWRIFGSFITEIKFGDLSYENDSLVTLDLTIKYDYATFQTDPTTVTSSTDESNQVNTE